MIEFTHDYFLHSNKFMEQTMIIRGCEKGIKIDNYVPSEGQTTIYEVILQKLNMQRTGSRYLTINFQEIRRQRLAKAPMEIQ